MKIGETIIESTFAEGFSMRCTRVQITAIDQYWLNAAVNEICGYGTSVIGCDAEMGVESRVPEEETLDGRVGAAVMAFSFSAEALEKAMINRVGQCVMTCPTTALFNGLDSQATIALGKQLRFFGDGFQKSKLLGERRFWRIPVMDGEFVVEDRCGIQKGVAGGNFLIQSTEQQTGLAAARRAIDAIDQIDGAITPFPGGVVRSGSKVGSRYKALRASTYDAYCPMLRERVESKLARGANCVYEIVIDGLDFDAVSRAMKAGIQAACGTGVVAIGAGNYGGTLGKHHFHLHEVMSD